MIYPAFGWPDHFLWNFRYRESALELLGGVAAQYRELCRIFRNEWGWAPQTIDALSIARICSMYNDLIEDRIKGETSGGFSFKRRGDQVHL